MDIQKINKAFNQLAEQSNQWIKQGFTPIIEKHLALQKLQEVYQDMIGDEVKPSEFIYKPKEQPQNQPERPTYQNTPERPSYQNAQERPSYQNTPTTIQSNNPTEFKPETIIIFNQEIPKTQADIFTRELFWRDSNLFESEIRKMESFKSLDIVIIYISEKYNWSPANQYANQFVEILEKYY